MPTRRAFVKECGLACLGLAGLGALEACAGHMAVEREIVGSDLIVPLADLARASHAIVRNERLRYPIVVYRLADDDYIALWMRCTHQGAELQVFDDTLQCPAHGSEFSNRGVVLTGPASAPLRALPVTRTGDRLTISLRAAEAP